MTYYRKVAVKLISPIVLKQYLAFRDMSYRELAERSQTSKSLIGFLATGRTTRTSADRARRIAKVLDVPVEAIFLPDVSSVRTNGEMDRYADVSGARGGRRSA